MMENKQGNPAQDGVIISLLNELYRLKTVMLNTKRTLILYYVFQDRKKDSLELHNMHTCAKMLVNNKLEAEIEEQKLGKRLTQIRYVLSEKQVLDARIKCSMFEVEKAKEGEEPYLNNIWIYENQEEANGEHFRVVVLPLQKDIIKADAQREQIEREEKEYKEQKEKIRKSNKKGDELTKAHNECDEQFKAKKEKRVQAAREKHLKMFRIEAFLKIILQKTDKVSLCSFFQIQNVDRYIKQLGQIFQTPKQLQAQYILHGYQQDYQQDYPNKETAGQISRKEITTVFSIQKNRLYLKTNEAWNQRYFLKTDKIKTKTFKNMQTHGNTAFSQVIMQFATNWKKITTNACLGFSCAYKFITSALLEQGAKQGSNTNLQISLSQIDISNSMNFEDVENAYLPYAPFLPTTDKLSKFYTLQRLGIKQVEEGESIMPKSIESMAFSHYLSKMGREFLKKVNLSRDEEQVLLVQWKALLKQIYELILSANQTLLSRPENRQYKCRDVQTYFNFVCFALESLNLINAITELQIATSSNLYKQLEGLKLKKETMMTHIIKNKQNIKKGQKSQPIHYYNIYLNIMKDNFIESAEKDIAYIYLKVHQYKGKQIASHYIYDPERITEAVKSYSLIVKGYSFLPQSQQKLLEIQKIQQTLAKLLKVLGLDEQAAKIYLKNRQYEHVDKCYNQCLLKLKGNAEQKMKKLLQWSNIFKNDFQFDLALSYIRRAFSYATSTQNKKKVVESKFQCLKKMKKPFTEEELRIHNKFIQTGNLMEYTSHVPLADLLYQLRVKLNWDKTAKRSTILEGDAAEQDYQDFMFSKMGGFIDRKKMVSQRL